MTTSFNQAQAFFDACKKAAHQNNTDRNPGNAITVAFAGRNINKTFNLKDDDSVYKSSHGIGQAYGMVLAPDTFEEMQSLLQVVSDEPAAVICNCGWKPVRLCDLFMFATETSLSKEGHARGDVIVVKGHKVFARIKEHSTPSAWLALDRDVDEHTPQQFRNLDVSAMLTLLANVLPGVDTCTRIETPSSSARIALDGKQYAQGNGHTWVKVADPSLVAMVKPEMIARCAEHGLVWHKPLQSKSTGEQVGTKTTTLIDISVWTPNGIVYAGKPTTTNPRLSVLDADIRVVKGTNDALTLPEQRLSTAQGNALLKSADVQGHYEPRASGGLELVEQNLTWATEIDTQESGWQTLRDVVNTMSGSDKVRCQAPFRQSSSYAAYVGLFQDGSPFVFDSGTGVKHVLSPDERYRGTADDFDDLTQGTPPGLPLDLSFDATFESSFNRIVSYLGYEVGDRKLALGALNRDAIREVWNRCGHVLKEPRPVFVHLRSDELIQATEQELANHVMTANFDSLFMPGCEAEMTERMNGEFGQGDTDGDADTGRDAGAADTDATGNAPKGSNAKQQRKSSGKKKSASQLVRQYLAKEIVLHRQAERLGYVTDPFARHDQLILDDRVLTIRRIMPPFELPAGVDETVQQRVWADFNEHFEEFQDLLRFVLYSRFAGDRKSCWMWFHAPSDFGKGFVMSALAQLGMTTTMTAELLEKAVTGQPVGLGAGDFVHSWVLWIDEFKKVKSEYKNLSGTLEISPKFRPTQKVEIFSRVCTSAEEVRGLVEAGVETQFANRFAYLKPANQRQTINQRDLFKELGGAQYHRALVAGIAQWLNTKVAELVGMGAPAAAALAEVELIALREKYPLDERAGFASLDNEVKALSLQMRQFARQWANEGWGDGHTAMFSTSQLTRLEREVSDCLTRHAVVGGVSVSKDGGNIDYRPAVVIKKPAEYIDLYLKHLAGLTPASVVKVGYKAAEIRSLLECRGDNDSRVRFQSQDGVTSRLRGVVVWLEPDPAEVADCDEAGIGSPYGGGSGRNAYLQAKAVCEEPGDDDDGDGVARHRVHGNAPKRSVH